MIATGKIAAVSRKKTDLPLCFPEYNLLTPLASINLEPTFNLTRKVLAIPALPFSKKSIILE